MFKKGTIVQTISDEYSIEQQIGEGGSGTAYRVCSSTGQIFALMCIFTFCVRNRIGIYNHFIP